MCPSCFHSGYAYRYQSNKNQDHLQFAKDLHEKKKASPKKAKSSVSKSKLTSPKNSRRGKGSDVRRSARVEAAGLVNGDDTTVGTANALFTTPSLQLDPESPSKVFVTSGRVENSPLVKQPSEDECSLPQAEYSWYGVSFHVDDDSSSDSDSDEDNSSSAKATEIVPEPRLPHHHGIELDSCIQLGHLSDNDPQEASSGALFKLSSSGANCSGVRYIFEVQSTTDQLFLHKVKSARVMPLSPHRCCAFISSSQLCPKQLSRNCEGCLIAFSTNKGPWYLGVVARLSYRMQQFDNPSLDEFQGSLEVYRWSGGKIVYAEGVFAPLFFQEKDIDSRMQDLIFEQHFFTSRKKSLDMRFLNQFSGPLPLTLSDYAPGIINASDGCLQCSDDGPDVFPLRIWSIEKCPPMSKRPAVEYVTQEMTGFPPAFVKNNTKTRPSRATAIRAAKDNDDELTAMWNRPPTLIRDRSMLASIAVVTDLNGLPLNLSSLRVKDSHAELYFVMSPKSK